MSSLAESNVHVREVLNIVNNQLPTRPTSDSVAQSWTRCLKEFRLDPARFVMPPVLTQQELTARREAASDLIACSKLEMTTLYQQLADPELAVVLVDADGVIETSGMGRELMARLRSEGSFTGRGFDFCRSATGCYRLEGPRLRLTELQMQVGSELYIGRGSTQDDGRLLLQLSSGAKQMRITGPLAQLVVE